MRDYTPKERRFDFGRPIGGIRPDPGAGVAPRQQLIHRLAVMPGGIGDVIASDQLVFSVHIYVVLVAVMAFPVLLGPVRINVFL